MPGWTRSGIAEEALQKLTRADDAPQVQRDFEAFLAGANTKRGGPLNQAERNALFREFMEWRERPDSAKR